MTLPRPRVAILGGGPGGYEAALVASQLGAEVTVVDEDGLGGACVLTDCVPSKTLIESSSTMTSLGRAASLGLQLADGGNPVLGVDAPALYTRIKALAADQSNDIAEHMAGEGIRVIQARGRLAGPHTIEADGATVQAARVIADVLALYGYRTADGDEELGVPLSQPELGSLIGASKEAVAKAIRQLREMGLVETKYRRIIVLDSDGLRSFAKLTAQ